MEGMKEKKYRVAIYCRVGNPGNADMALELQKSMLREYAMKKGYEVAAEICETATGRSTDRDGIREILSLAGQKAMDEVLAVGYSRYGRNMADMLLLKYSLEEQHIKLKALKGIPTKIE